MANRLRMLVSGFIFLSSVGCAGPFKQVQFYADEPFSAPNFNLKGASVGFVAPSSREGLEEDKWILLDIFAKTLQEKQKDTVVVLPSTSFSLINEAGMARDYHEMIRAYRVSGILDRGVLNRLGKVLGVQYVIHVKLSDFVQYPATRLSIFGFRTVDSQIGKMRMFVQIVETHQGRITWEGSGEGIITQEEFRARPITFNELARLASERLVEKLP